MSAVDAFWAAPPISRTLAASTFFLSILVHTSILPGYWVIFSPSFLLKIPPQAWRFVTSFLISGSGLSIIFDPYFLYIHGSKLETASPRFSRPGDFFTYLLFMCAVILGLNVFVAGGVVFTSALVLGLCYTSAQDDRGQKATFFIVTVPALWIPFLMLLMTFVMAGPAATMQQGTGLIAAHLHDFLSRLWPSFGGGRNIVMTPAFVRRIWESRVATTTDHSYGTAFQPAQRSSGTASGSSTGVLPESWRNRGSGHRLGGD